MTREGLAAASGLEVVGTASDGAELVDLVRTTFPDVALVEIALPGVDGLAALRQLAGIYPAHEAPARAMLTTFDRDEHVDTALAAGAVGYLLKGRPIEQLCQAVRDLAGGGVVLDPAIAARLLPRMRAAAADAALVQAAKGLSAREREVLSLLGLGASNAEIGRRLRIAESTVKGHVTAVLTKLGANNRVQAAVLARRVEVADRELPGRSTGVR